MATTNTSSYTYSDAPEVVSQPQPGLEPVEHSTLEASQPTGVETWKYSGQHSTLEHNPSTYQSPEAWKQESSAVPRSPTEQTPALAHHGHVNGDGGFGGGEVGRAQITGYPVRKRKRWWLVGGVVALLAVIAIVLGCVLGLRKKSNGDINNNASASVCNNAICPQIIAVPQNYDGRLNIFARGTDNLIHWRYCPDAAGTEWKTIPNVEFISQPSAIAWGSGQVQVTAISSDKSTGQTAAKGNVFTSSIQPAARGDFSGWQNLGETAAGAAPLCVVPKDTYTADYPAGTTLSGPNRVDVWTVESQNKVMAHNFWEPDKNVWMSDGVSNAWDMTVGENQVVGSIPAVTCRDDEIQHDVVVYTTSKEAKFRAYSHKNGNWSDWEGVFQGAKFAGDPVTVAVGSDRFDFFGIDATTKVLLHATWTSKDKFSALEAVGNMKLSSVPSIMVTGTDRLDVVALGPDVNVMHQTLIGSAWNNDWEIVGDPLVGNSAPVVSNFKCDDTGSDCTAVLVLGLDNELKFGYFPSRTDRSYRRWEGLVKWQSLGGNLTAEYMEVS